jgi:hypothetical protein
VYSGQHWLNWGTLANQGQFVPWWIPISNPDKLPAGNEFKPTNRKQISSVTGSPIYIYFHHDPATNPYVKPLPITSNIFTFQDWPLKALSSCLPLQLPPIDQYPMLITEGIFLKLDTLQHKIDSLQLIYNQQTANIDQGQTQLLLGYIGTLPQGTLKNELISHSPLSDTVLIRLHDVNPLSNGNYKNVMERNLPVSKEVESWFLAKLGTLPQGIVQQLTPLQGWNSLYNTPAQTAQMIQDLKQERLLLLNQLIIGLTDTTIYNRRSDAVLLLENETTDFAKMALAGSYLEDGDYVKVNSKLNALNQNIQDNIDFVDYYHVLLAIVQSGRSIYDITQVEANTLRQIAVHCPSGLAIENAQSLLYAVFGEQFPPCTINGNARTINNPAPDEITDQSNLGENYPDPFSNMTNIPYYLPDGIKGTLIIKTVEGKTIASYPLISGNQVFQLKTVGWADGVYYYGIIGDVNETVYKKMVLIK